MKATEATRSAPQAHRGVAAQANGTLAQPREALRIANEVRSRRAQLKRELKLGHASPAEVVGDPPEWMATATARVVLESSRRIGPVKAARILRRAGISPTRELGSLSRTERRLLVAAIGSRGGARMISDGTVLAKLDEIGGGVEASELAYHLGPDAAYAAFELAEEGLVASTTYFSLTAAGREALASSPGPRKAP